MPEEINPFIIENLLDNLIKPPDGYNFEKSESSLMKKLGFSKEPSQDEFKMFLERVIVSRYSVTTLAARNRDVCSIMFDFLDHKYYGEENQSVNAKVSVNDRFKLYMERNAFFKESFKGRDKNSDQRIPQNLSQTRLRQKNGIVAFLYNLYTENKCQQFLDDAMEDYRLGRGDKLKIPYYTVENFSSHNHSNIEDIDSKKLSVSEKESISESGWKTIEQPCFTIEQVDAGALDNQIVFNSICNNPKINNNDNHDERKFIGAREADSNMNWETDTVFVENNKQYEICIRIKNDNPNGIEAVAKNTKVSLDLPKHYAKTIPVMARITSENANPQNYEAQMFFNNRINFKLEIIENSIFFKNEIFGNGKGVQLSTDLFNRNTVRVGYDRLNGIIPGGDKYACYIIFKVKAVLDVYINILYTVETKVRLAGDTDKTWKKAVDAKIGDKVEFQIQYRNTDVVKHDKVIVDSDLPANLKYVEGSTILYNALHSGGMDMHEDDVVKTGLIIGNYEPKTNAYVRFTAEVVDETFTCGLFTLRNWGRATVGSKVIQDSADVNVQLAHCPDAENN